MENPYKKIINQRKEAEKTMGRNPGSFDIGKLQAHLERLNKVKREIMGQTKGPFGGYRNYENLSAQGRSHNDDLMKQYSIREGMGKLKLMAMLLCFLFIMIVGMAGFLSIFSAKKSAEPTPIVESNTVPTTPSKSVSPNLNLGKKIGG